MSNALTSKIASLSASETAAHLSKSLGRSTTQWEVWLANDRRPERVNSQLPTVPGQGRPRYAPERIDAFVSAYLLKQTEDSGRRERNKIASRSKQFAAHISAVTSDQGIEAPFVLLVTVSPLRTYKLTAIEARKIARQLIISADEVEPHLAQT